MILSISKNKIQLNMNIYVKPIVSIYTHSYERSQSHNLASINKLSDPPQNTLYDQTIALIRNTVNKLQKLLSWADHVFIEDSIQKQTDHCTRDLTLDTVPIEADNQLAEWLRLCSQRPLAAEDTLFQIVAYTFMFQEKITYNSIITDTSCETQGLSLCHEQNNHIHIIYSYIYIKFIYMFSAHIVLLNTSSSFKINIKFRT